MIPSKAGKGVGDFPGSGVSCPATSVEHVVGEEGWKPQKTEWLIMLSMALVSLIVAIDATILVTVLPASYIQTNCEVMTYKQVIRLLQQLFRAPRSKLSGLLLLTSSPMPWFNPHLPRYLKFSAVNRLSSFPCSSLLLEVYYAP
jgi:hypothetical protein